MRKTAIICFMLVFGLTSLGAFSANAGTKKVLYVDSYHAEYKPSMIMHEAVSNVLEPAGVEIKFVYMNAKRQKSDEQLRISALRIKSVIEKWEPDIVLAADDAASKYLVKPYYKDANLPFVFIGVNWRQANIASPPAGIFAYSCKITSQNA